jgi:transposase
MYMCILSQDGEILLHRNMQTSPEMLLKAIAPYREDLVVCGAGIFTWDWLADLCARAGMPFVLGHALSLQAIHGGKANNEKIDAQTIAVLLRGGMRPQAYVSPAAMRATRDLRRRRTHLMRKRAEWLTPIPQPKSQYNLPEIGKKIADKAHRAGVAERFPDPAVHKSIEVARALSGHDDPLLRDVELSILHTAKQPNAQTLSLRRTVPGIGAILRWVLLYEIPDITRFPRVQACRSSCRLVTCPQESAGTRDGTAGTKRGNAPLPWACSEAAVLWLRANPAGQQYLTQLEKTPGAGTALTRLSQQRGRAVYYMVQRQTAFDMDTLLHGSGSGADEPYAALDHHGLSLRIVLCNAWVAASVNAEEHRGLLAQSLGPLIGPPLRLLSRGESRVSLPCAAPPPSLALPGARHPCSHPFAEDGTRGQRSFEGVATPRSGLYTRRHRDERPSRRVWGSLVGAPANGHDDRTRCQRRTTLRRNPSGKNGKNPL